MLTAQQILKIDKNQPELLFSGDPTKLEKEFKQFKIQWHPDRNCDPQATDVLSHIAELYFIAEQKLKSGLWNPPNLLRLTDTKSGKAYEIKYVKSYSIEIGTMYLSHKYVTFIIESQYKELYENALAAFSRFKFHSDRMKEEISKCLPRIKATLEIGSGCVLILEKDPDLIPLTDINEYFKHQLDSRHIAWIVSTLYNLNCYLAYAQITHNDISLSTYFIDPTHHSGALLGGWWYSALESNKLTYVPRRIINNIPPDMLASKKPDHRIDLELVRGVARELICGDWNNIHLVRDDKRTPEALKNWSISAASNNPVEEYNNWQQVLQDSFGKKKFVELKASWENLYGGNSK